MDENVRVNEKLLEQAVSLSGEDNAEKVFALRFGCAGQIMWFTKASCSSFAAA